MTADPVTVTSLLIAGLGIAGTTIKVLYGAVSKSINGRIDHLDQGLTETKTELANVRDDLKDCQEDRVKIWKTVAMQNGKSVNDLQNELAKREAEETALM